MFWFLIDLVHVCRFSPSLVTATDRSIVSAFLPEQLVQTFADITIVYSCADIQQSFYSFVSLAKLRAMCYSLLQPASWWISFNECLINSQISLIDLALFLSGHGQLCFLEMLFLLRPSIIPGFLLLNFKFFLDCLYASTAPVNVFLAFCHPNTVFYGSHWFPSCLVPLLNFTFPKFLALYISHRASVISEGVIVAVTLDIRWRSINQYLSWLCPANYWYCLIFSPVVAGLYCFLYEHGDQRGTVFLLFRLVVFVWFGICCINNSNLGSNFACIAGIKWCLSFPHHLKISFWLDTHLVINPPSTGVYRLLPETVLQISWFALIFPYSTDGTRPDAETRLRQPALSVASPDTMIFALAYPHTPLACDAMPPAFGLSDQTTLFELFSNPQTYSFHRFRPEQKCQFQKFCQHPIIVVFDQN